MTIAMTVSRPSDFREAMAAPKVTGLLSRAWAPSASFVLHGAALAAVLWALQEPEQSPANTAIPLIAMEFVAPPAPVAAEQPTAEPPAAELMTAETAPPSDTMADVPPILESQVAEAPLPPAQKAKPMAEQKPIAKAESKPQARPVKTAAQSEPKAIPADTAVAALEAAVPSPHAAPGPAPAAPQQAAVPVVAPRATVAPPSDYVGLLRQQLERNKVYPRTAQQRRQQGSAMVRIAIDRGGQVLSFKIEQSSGYELLDREVVAMVQRASPLPPIPAGLELDRLEVVVPVEFFLR